MKTKRCSLAVRIVALVLLCALPLASLPMLAFLTPPVFSDTFVGALDDKYDRLASIEEPKVILLGGSSVAFGFDSALIEQTLDMPVVNFGLYADLGTKIMMDLVRDHVNEGDILLFAPEIDAQTLSLYFNSDTALRALESRPSLLLQLPADNFFACLGASFNFVTAKMEYLQGGRRDTMTDIYQSAYFNAYGDVDGELDLDGDGEADHPRRLNVMPGYADVRHPVDLSPEAADEDFLAYAQQLQAHCERRGAEFYYAYCPMNKLGLYEDSEQTRDAYERLMRDTFGKDAVLGRVQTYLYEPHWFFDSNFHLNSAGTVHHTIRILNDLLMKRGDMTTVVEAEDPPPPSLPPPDLSYDAEDEHTRYFTFERIRTYNAELGIEIDRGYYITGLTDEGLAADVLTVPIAYEGVRVTGMAEGALTGSAATAVVIPEIFDTLEKNAGAAHVFSFGTDSLRGSQITDIYLYLSDRDSILPTVGIGEKQKLTIHVPVGTSYENGYFWSQELARCTFVYDLTLD